MADAAVERRGGLPDTHVGTAGEDGAHVLEIVPPLVLDHSVDQIAGIRVPAPAEVFGQLFFAMPWNLGFEIWDLRLGFGIWNLGFAIGIWDLEFGI